MPDLSDLTYIWKLRETLVLEREQAFVERVDGDDGPPGRQGTVPGKLSSRHALISLGRGALTTRTRVRTVTTDLIPTATKKLYQSLFLQCKG